MNAVLLTRPEAQSAATQKLLQAAGQQVYIAPLLEIEPLDWAVPEPLPQAVLLTSANAIPALQQSDIPRDIPVYAVGDSTAAQAAQAGFTRVNSAAGDVKALTALVLQSCDNGLGALLHLAGEAIAGHLAADLAAAGFWVETRIVYRALAATALPPDAAKALQQGQITSVLLYSPRSAAIFARLVAEPAQRQQLVLCCLSAAIAQAAGTGWKEIRLAAHPDEDSLLKCLAQMPSPV